MQASTTTPSPDHQIPTPDTAINVFVGASYNSMYHI